MKTETKVLNVDRFLEYFDEKQLYDDELCYGIFLLGTVIYDEIDKEKLTGTGFNEEELYNLICLPVADLIHKKLNDIDVKVIAERVLHLQKELFQKLVHDKTKHQDYSIKWLTYGSKLYGEKNKGE